MVPVLNLLQKIGSSPIAFNPWTEVDSLDVVPDIAALARRNRLAMHLDVYPEYLLIGEAPGWRGCHFSGVPFTSEALLMSGGIPRIQRLIDRITTRDPPFAESAATIVWRTLYQLGIAERTVLWNAMATHPHFEADLHSNRRPSRAELRSELNVQVLRQIMDAYPGVRVVAVGDIATTHLHWLGYRDCYQVRHPSMGGATLFAEGMREIVGEVHA